MNLFNLPSEKKEELKDLPIFNIDKKEFEMLNPKKLLDGFEKLQCVTFSSSISQTIELISQYGLKEIEIIIGLSEDYKEISALQNMSEGISEILLNSINLEIYSAKNIHTKLYLLSDSEEKKRVITGSANLSQIAWSGKQKEIFLYSDDEEIYNQFEVLYHDIKDNSVCLIGKSDLEKEKKSLKNKLQLKVGNLENLTIENADEKTFKIIQENVKNIENIAISNLVVNLNINKTKIEENRLKLQAEEKFLKKMDLLLDHRKEILLKKEKAIPEILSNKSKKEIKQESLDELPFRIFYKKGKYFINFISQINNPNEERVKYELKNLSNILKEIEEDNPEITPYVMETIMFAFSSGYMWYLRKQKDVDKTTLPIFGFLAGMGGAGKSLTLEIIKKLTRGILEQDKNIKDRGKFVDAYFLSDEIFGINPLLIDEIKLSAIRNTSSALHSRIKELTNTLDKNIYGVIIGAFNLSQGNLQIELLRRIFYISFKNPLSTNLKQRISKYLKNLDWNLYLRFLSILDLEKLSVDKITNEDILYPVRVFFKSLSEEHNIYLPVSDKYLGSYESFMIKEWKLYYLTQKEAFHSFYYKKANKHAYRVKQENFLVTLPEFALDSSGDYYVIDKEKFLKAIEEKETTERKFNFFKSFFKK